MTDLHTMDEAASKLRMSRRNLQDWLSDHPVDCAGIPFFIDNGNRKRFTDADLDRIIKAQREETLCRLNSERRVKAKPRTTRYAGRTSESGLTEALKLASEPLPRKSSMRLNARSNVVAMPSRVS